MDELIRRVLQLPPRASSAAPGIDHLHYVVIGLAFATAFITFGALLLFIARYRDRPGKPRARPPASSGLKNELIFSAFTLAVFIALWVIGFDQFRATRTPAPNATQIYVVGKQWMWQLVYPDGSATEDELRVPVGQPVELLLTSRDVIHSFYVPALRLKQDAVPGHMTALDFTPTQAGTYPILCAEYCGAGHARMRGAVIAMEPADYARWAASHPATDLAQDGRRIMTAHGCPRCHEVAKVAPPLGGIYGTSIPLVDGTTVKADAAYLTESIMDPAAKVRAGYTPTMPSYLGQLTAGEVAAIVEAIRISQPPARSPAQSPGASP